MERTIAVFSSREDLRTLLDVVDSASAALRCREGAIDVVINGNRLLAATASKELGLAKSVPRGGRRALSVWFSPFADKAQAWNDYVQHIWPGSEYAFFIDGYARIRPNAIDLIVAGMSADTHAWAGSGVPTKGRSARFVTEQMVKYGGFAGNLGAIKGPVLRRMADSGFKLPVGLYRVDSVIGSAIMFSLDPANHDWDPKRVFISTGATWDYKPLRWWHPYDLLTHWRRRKRQMRGIFENAAVRHWQLVEKRPPFGWPTTVQGLVEYWAAAAPEECRKLREKSRSHAAAFRELLQRSPTDFEAAKPEFLGAREIIG